jgi:hypothetical protein
MASSFLESEKLKKAGEISLGLPPALHLGVTKLFWYALTEPQHI